jgi:hypothetical protein
MFSILFLTLNYCKPNFTAAAGENHFCIVSYTTQLQPIFIQIIFSTYDYNFSSTESVKNLISY